MVTDIIVKTIAYTFAFRNLKTGRKETGKTKIIVNQDNPIIYRSSFR